MKKIFYFIASAIVALGAVACQNDINEGVTPEQEGFSINANIGDITRIAITDSENKEGYKTLSWEGTETLTAYLKGEGFEFTNTTEAPNTFTCTTPGVKAKFEEEYATSNSVEFYYNYNLLISGEYDKHEVKYALVGQYKGGEEAINMTVAGCIFHFSCTEEVTLKYSYPLEDGKSYGAFLGGMQELTFSAGEYYIGATVRSEETTLEAWIGDEKVKSTTQSFEENKIYNLGTIEKPAPVASEYGVVGSFQAPTTWDVAAPVVMYVEGDWAVAKGVELYKDDEFKIVKGNSWNVNFGLSAPGVLALDEEVAITSSNSQNMKAAKNGKFDIYFNATANKIKYTCVEEYTDLKVNITINNEAKWSPLSITLKNDNTTIVNNATVSNNVYAVSGDYIGMSLSYTLTNGSKTSEGNVTITRDGAIINLVEQVIRITFVLDTDNTKKYWGTEAYIYIWNTDPSVNNSWPGTKMIYDGNYTFHYDLPAALKGKKLTYIINRQTNGNWQSKDSTIASLSLDGHTITGSSINIE